MLYLYSNKNIVGSALGITGLLISFGLVLAGSQTWLFAIIPAMYAIGALITPNSPTYQLALQNQTTIEEIHEELERLMRKIQGKVSEEILAKVNSIRLSILDILPLIVDVNAANHDIFVIRQTALDYLPNALENYLNLPPAYARLHAVRDRKTAQQLLLEQLDLLDHEMKEIVADFNQDNTQKLMAHGRFLQDKFYEGDVLGR